MRRIRLKDPETQKTLVFLLMANQNALSAAFITALNPFSQNLLAKENKARQDERKASAQKARIDLHRLHWQAPQ